MNLAHRESAHGVHHAVEATFARQHALHELLCTRRVEQVHLR
jgi:hypothetical protein